MFRSPIDRRSNQAGFTVIELLILLVILAILAFALLPAAMRARTAARMTMSKNNLAQLGKAIKHYEGVGRGGLAAEKWEEALKPYLEDAEEIFTCPMRDKEARNGGVYSYALNSRVAKFGAADHGKIAMVTSDHRVIDIETKKCIDGKPVITGEPVARQDDLALALMYGGNVRAFEFAEIDLSDESYEPLVVWWLANREHREVCGKVIVIDDPDAEDETEEVEDVE